MIPLKRLQSALAAYRLSGQRHINEIRQFYRTFANAFTRQGIWLATAAVVPDQTRKFVKASLPHPWIRHDVLRRITNHLQYYGFVSTSKESHQYRIQNILLQGQADILASQTNQILNLQNFDDILAHVESIKIHGFGELTAYDTALRIGFILNKLPRRIYLHAGVRLGANLLGLNTKGRDFITPQEITNMYFNLHLQPYEIENFLCSQRDDF